MNRRELADAALAASRADIDFLEAYCNGDITAEEYEANKDRFTDEANRLFDLAYPPQPGDARWKDEQTQDAPTCSSGGGGGF